VDAAWEGIFLLLVLKIPLIYLCVVVWWAIRAEPVEGGGSGGEGAPISLSPCGWDDWKRHRGPGGRPVSPNCYVPRLRAQRARAAAA
jgi:hypothetical protein